MLIFEKVRYKNFLSTGNTFTEIDLNEYGTTCISGLNGSGKSTMLDGISFALFNKPFRNINKPSLINSINNSGLVAELYFTSNTKKYKIIRGMKPNIFEIYENDKLINQDASSRDYQQYLEETILCGLNEKVFKQVVILGSADYQPFMQLRSHARREVIEELLDIKIFSHMLDIAKNCISSIRDSLKQMDYNISLCEEKIKIFKEQHKKQISDKDDRKEQIKIKIKATEDIITEKQTSLDEKKNSLSLLTQKYSGFDLLKSSYTDLVSLHSSLNVSQKRHKQSIELFEKNSKCPTCSQDIDKAHASNILKESYEQINSVQEGIEKVAEKIKEKENNFSVFEKIQKMIEKVTRETVTLESEITSLSNNIKEYNEQLLEIDDTTIDDSEINNLSTTLNSLIEERKVKLKEQEYYTIAIGLLKDGGIKTKIINQYIPIMNKLINEYLVRFGLPIEFTLDDQFNEIIKSRYRDQFQYNNFSEGEKQRIDTALMLTWRQIAKMKNTTNTNLLIFDEVFDSSLDQSATDELMNILLSMDKDTNIFVISHKNDLADKMQNHIEFEKIGNFSKMKKVTG